MKHKYPHALKMTSRKTASNKEQPGWIHRQENGQLHLQLPLPLAEALDDSMQALEGLSRQIGVLIARAVLEAEAEQLAGPTHAREPGTPYRWSNESGHLVFDGQKVPLLAQHGHGEAVVRRNVAGGGEKVQKDTGL